MPLRDVIGAELPYLRRYARAVTGSQKLGDAAVRETLEALVEAPGEFDLGKPPRNELFRTFHRIWNAASLAPIEVATRNGTVASLPIKTREALLLTAVEGFSENEAATILNLSPEETARHIDTARAAITEALTGTVLIIEDESIIALHIKSIVEDLGHDVAGIARTRGEAVAMAAQTNPELVLADISLADGSSGIDAVKDILAIADVPVIFITAFPERLLTGERPEPTYLITKPFSPETVAATIGQVLLFHREQASIAARPATLVMEVDAPNPRKHFDTPEALLADPGLADKDKQALLTEGDSEIDGRLNAESEGMGVSDPLTARKEAQLADEARHVKTALTTVSEKIACA
jgi:CheY-like chemotaxis protein